MPDASPVAVELNDVYKTYRLYRDPAARFADQMGLSRILGAQRARGRFVEFDALRGVTLAVPKGGRLGIVGRNGAGKTTLLKLLTGNLAPTKGSVTVCGAVQALLHVGIGFHPEFTGLENVRSALLYNGLSGAALEKAVADVIDFCELGDFLHQPLGTYSLGMRMRLQFAAATAIQPEILIIDEIMSAGDAYFSAKSAHRMKRLTQSGCTLLLVSHSPYQVLEFCDHAVWLEDGAVRMQGEAADVVGAYETHLHELTHSHEQGLPHAGQSERSHGQEKRIRLADGREAYRWPGKTGLKIDRAVLTDGMQEIQRALPGSTVRLELDIRVERTGTYSCSYLATLWSDRMRRVARIEGQESDFAAHEGDVRRITADLTPFLLAHGRYSLWLSIYDRGRGLPSGAETRFDVLARCLTLAVTDEVRAREPFYEHPCTWSFQ